MMVLSCPPSLRCLHFIPLSRPCRVPCALGALDALDALDARYDVLISGKTDWFAGYASRAVQLKNPMGVNAISPARLHVRSMWALSTCR